MIELQTELPLAKRDRTQTPPPKPGEPIFVPKGTKILSRGVQVTSSDEYPIIGELEMITDGNQEKEHAHYYVELVDGLQWVQLDLGKPYSLHAILVWHYYYSWDTYDYSMGGLDEARFPRMYQDVVVQISSDPTFKKDVTTVFNNDHDNSSGLGKGEDDTYVETSEGLWIDTKGVEGRYVRLYSNGYIFQHYLHDGRINEQKRELNHYVEIEVYGK